MRKNIAVAAACITFAVLIGNSVNVSAESIPVTKKQVQLLSGVVKNVAKIKPVQKKGPDVEVGLLSGQSQVEIEGLSHFRIETNGKVWKSYNAGKRISVSRKGKNIVLEGKAFNAPVYFTTGNGEEAFSVKGNRYRGEMKIIPSAWNNGVTVVNRVPMELYLKGVVPSEIVPSWKPDAIKAQAVAARTYAVYHKNGYRSAGYDMTDDTRSQVYRGCSVETSATNKAVEETAGEIITYNGKTNETDSTDSFTGVNVCIGGTLCTYIGGSHICGKLVWTCCCPRTLLLCSLVHPVAVVAGCQSAGHVSSGKLFQKNQ